VKAGQASTTAKVIAASTLLLANLPEDQFLVPAGAAALSRHFLSTNWTDRCLATSATSAWTQWWWRGLERITHPGIMRHYLLRKDWIEAQCRLALQEGVQRIIVIGAGLDTLALRLAPQWPKVTWVEIDHPATQAYKLRGLTQACLDLSVNLTLKSVDLSISSLPSEMLHDSRRTLVVIEGMLMYLDEANVVDLMRDQVLELSTKSVSLIFSYMVRWTEGRSGFRPSSWLVDRWLSWRAEPFKWTMAPQALPPWLLALGFELLEQSEPPFRRDFASLSGCLRGENLVKCQVIKPQSVQNVVSG
jgi:methyltransferase (TIGR00027 family)